MNHRLRSFIAAVAAVALILPQTAFGTPAAATPEVGGMRTAVAAPAPAAATEAAGEVAPPLLVTEVVTDSAPGKQLTYTEVYNNSDADLNLKDYIFFYAYEGGMGTGRMFGSDKSKVEYQYASGNADLIVAPGKTMVLWQSKGGAGGTIDDFNAFYGTNLVENKDIVRIPYGGIHSSAKRAYFFGRDADSILCGAWSNATGDQIAKGNPEAQGIQYKYPGTGRTSEVMGVSAATPGLVSAEQVPATRVHYVAGQSLSIDKAEAAGDDGLSVTAEVPYEGTAGAAVVSLHYRQKAGAQTQDFIAIEMTPAGDGKTFTGSVPSDKLFSDSVEWYVTATYDGSNPVSTQPQTTTVKLSVPDAKTAAPFYVTEVGANPQSKDGKQYSYFEVYNQSDKPINLSYFKIFYYYNYPAQTAQQSGKVWTLSDFTAELAPGETMVYWLSNNNTTVDDFNAFWGCNLELGKNIVQVNYAGLHGTDNRWIRFGTSEEDAFTVAGFNTDRSQIAGRGTALQFSYPHGDGTANASIPAMVAPATPGAVADWQHPATALAEFQGYPGYPADDGQAPTLELATEETPAVPTELNEGEQLKVMYKVDCLVNSVSRDRLSAFKDGIDPNNPTNTPGGAEALAKRPYLIGTEICYKLDDDAAWTVIKERTQWRLGHFLAQIPADVLFGHDKLTFKVRAHTLYGVSETPENVVKINRLNDTAGSVRLNLHEGQIVSGTTTVTANDGADNSTTQLYVDGVGGEQERMLENGAWYMIKTKGMDNYFKDAVTAPLNGNPDIITIMNPWCESPHSRAVHVDNKYFTYNAATDSYDVDLTIWAGSSGTPYAEIYDVVKRENHEDFELSGLQLRLPNGKDFLPTKILPDNARTNTSTALDAWHTVGDSRGMIPYLVASFSIPAQAATAVGRTIDTTALADGTHTLMATGNDRSSAVSFIVDNTAPAIDAGFASGSVVDAPFTLDAGIAQDANAISDVTVVLDGNPVALPTTIVPRELAAGNHMLVVVAADEAGNIAKSEIPFTTEETDPAVEPSAPEQDWHDANLSVKVGEGPVDVEFLQGRALSLDKGVAAQTALETASADGTAPYQLFSIEVDPAAAGDAVRASWKGAADGVDDTHPLTLFAFNQAASAWDAVASTTSNEDAKALEATFPAADYTKDGKVFALVQCVTAGTGPTVATLEDAQASASDQAMRAQALTDWDGTGRPADYDFAFAWETDTQYYAESFPYHYDHMNQWVVDNAADWKIKYVFHTGDIVDDVDMTGEWRNADHSMQIFDDAGMPYGVLGGNHDVYAGAENYGNYWKFFGEDRFANKPWYGGSYKNNLGHYDLITEQGQDFIMLYMSWDIYEDELNWMNEVLAQYPDRKAILNFHRYIGVGGGNDRLDYTGKLISDQVVAKNPNVFMVLNGHYHGSSILVSAFDDDGDGAAERPVYQICTDYQSEPEGGGEYLKFLYFDLEKDKVYVNSYSPCHNDFNYYDAAKLGTYAPGLSITGQDIAELDYRFDLAEKQLSTTAFNADVLTQTQIGSVSGATDVASTTWSGLDADTEYGWYARVTNARGGITVTPVDTFSLKQGEGKVRRLAGSTALDTMTEVMNDGWDASDMVVVATSEGYWDALTAAGVAGLSGAPILMTAPGELSAQTKAELERLKPAHVVIAGGTTAVSETVEAQVAEAAGVTPVRCAGEDAVATAEQLYAQGPEIAGTNWSDTAFVATNAGYWDALAASPIAYARHAPIFLTNGPDSITDGTVAALKAGEFKRVYICGGAAAISPAVVEQLAMNDVPIAGRLAGPTAIETAMELAAFGLSEGMTARNLGAATMGGYWDALTGAPLCGRANSPLVLVGDPASAAVIDFIAGHKADIETLSIFGGMAAVSDEVEQAICEALGVAAA